MIKLDNSSLKSTLPDITPVLADLQQCAPHIRPACLKGFSPSDSRLRSRGPWTPGPEAPKLLHAVQDCCGDHLQLYRPFGRQQGHPHCSLRRVIHIVVVAWQGESTSTTNPGPESDEAHLQKLSLTCAQHDHDLQQIMR